ncbi:MAG: SDR family oxidoreductase [Clostridia bacterium]|nr:SDR family oxidoreductase [Clostridia bacterium]
MKAFVTGASSGMGRDMARYLSSKGYDLILVGRNNQKLLELKSELKTDSRILNADLSKVENVMELYKQIEDEDIDIAINDAGFGVFGEFWETDLEKELNLIGTNITALHILTKLFLEKMRKKNAGYILNVSSMASFTPGPLMATYYASKAYVTYLSRAISKELEKADSKIVVSTLCPGPVATNFNNVAGVNFSMKPMTSEYVAKYAIDNLLKGKRTIIPGKKNKFLHFLSKLAPSNLAMNAVYKNQTKKIVK